MQSDSPIERQKPLSALVLQKEHFWHPNILLREAAKFWLQVKHAVLGGMKPPKNDLLDVQDM